MARSCDNIDDGAKPYAKVSLDRLRAAVAAGGVSSGDYTPRVLRSDVAFDDQPHAHFVLRARPEEAYASPGQSRRVAVRPGHRVNPALISAPHPFASPQLSSHAAPLRLTDAYERGGFGGSPARQMADEEYAAARLTAHLLKHPADNDDVLRDNRRSVSSFKNMNADDAAAESGVPFLAAENVYERIPAAEMSSTRFGLDERFADSSEPESYLSNSGSDGKENTVS